MKNEALLFLFVILSLMCHSQEVGFTDHTAVEFLDGPAGVYIADLNNDSTNDIVSASADDNTIAWWENDGQNPPSWSKHVITSSFQGAIYVSCGDINGDSYIDILGAAWDGNELAWWENPGTDGNTWQKHLVRENYTQAHEIMPYDIDSDQDMDILGVSAGLNSISLFVNDGNNPPGFTERTITTTLTGARSVDAADFDGDGDIDVCGAGLLNNRIEWFRNDDPSLSVWSQNIVKSGFASAHKVQAVDMNHDGRPDILGTAYNGGIAWWKNVNGENISWEEDFVSGFSYAVIGWSFDYDNDNDMDIFCSAQGFNKLAFWENTDGNFSWQYHLLDNLSGAWPLHYGDLDGDTDIDLVCGGRDANKICWYENELTSVGINDPGIQMDNIHINCYPNPFTSHLNIMISSEIINLIQIDIYDNSGKNIFSSQEFLKPENPITLDWDVTSTNGYQALPGLYYIRFTTDNLTTTRKVTYLGSGR